jgi:hypothetical protein
MEGKAEESGAKSDTASIAIQSSVSIVRYQ